MPELPEVETTLCGIKPHIVHKVITNVIVREHRLRWLIPSNFKKILVGQAVQKVWRRGKYLLIDLASGTIILHLGMSGSLRILNSAIPAKKHDHVDIIFSDKLCLRLTDPRRFGACLWATGDPLEHSLLINLGPEPLSAKLTGSYLQSRAKSRKVPIKSFIMDSKVVVGVGNIYATEALFAAGIHPEMAAGQVSLTRFEALVVAIKTILKSAIKQGGTTLKDFLHTDGGKGYFKVYLKVYGRGGLPCLECKSTLIEIRLNQRSTVFCTKCQRSGR
jgi:formamidopyrimidine-DNA glycosylase